MPRSSLGSLACRGAVVLAATSLLPLGLGVPRAGAAVAVSCATMAGTTNFSPALPMAGDSKTAIPTQSATAAIGGCTGGGITSGNISFVVTASHPENCATAAKGYPYRGGGRITWNSGQSSVLTIALEAVPGHTTEGTLESSVTSGPFQGTIGSVTIALKLPSGACTSAPLSTASFTQLTPLVFRLPAGSSTPAVAVVASPNAPGAARSLLYSVSCSSASDCMGVGWSCAKGPKCSNILGEGVAKTLIERWNGATWVVVPSPNPAGDNGSFLWGVSCTSTTFCVAVGNTANLNAKPVIYKTLIEQWNGTRWKIVASPNASGRGSSNLFGVSCTSPVSCIAVGNGGFSNTPNTTLVEQLKGTTWKIVASPNPAIITNGTDSTGSILSGVSCTSSTFCAAVGDAVPASGPTMTLVEHWNGLNWSVVKSPSPGATASVLTDVSCTSLSFCIADDYADSTGAGLITPLVEQWNGSTWSVVPVPSPVSTVLHGVSCTSPTQCLAVGYGPDGTGQDQTLVEKYDGLSWTIIDSPGAAGNSSNRLDTVSCANPTTCTAVGRYWTDLILSFKTLVLQTATNPDFVIVSCAKPTSCSATVSSAASGKAPAQSVVISGTPTAETGTEQVTIAPAKLACATGGTAVAPVVNLSTTGFAASSRLTVTATLRKTKGASSRQVCYHSSVPFKSQSSPSAAKAGTALLLACGKVANVAPCLVSTKQVGANVVVKFAVPGGSSSFRVVSSG